jgi:hypothetical protein
VRTSMLSHLKSERGIALVMILVLSAIVLAIMAALVYMVTSGTQAGGMHKRYKTALEAGKGGADLTYQFISLRGDSSGTNYLLSELASASPSIPSSVTTPSSCCGYNRSGAYFCGPDGGWKAKLNTPTVNLDGTNNWSAGCNSYSTTIVPGDPSTYDLTFSLPGASGTPTYTVYAKIVDTVEGNSGTDEGLIGKGVVSSGSGEIEVPSIPYLYTMEMDSENTSNPSERAKLSVLYQY